MLTIEKRSKERLIIFGKFNCWKIPNDSYEQNRSEEPENVNFFLLPQNVLFLHLNKVFISREGVLVNLIDVHICDVQFRALFADKILLVLLDLERLDPFILKFLYFDNLFTAQYLLVHLVHLDLLKFLFSVLFLEQWHLLVDKFYKKQI